MKRIDTQTPRIHLLIIIIVIVIAVLQSPCLPASLQQRQRQRPPSTARESSRVEARCIAPVMRADATRHETTQDDTRRYIPAALCNAIMQCNAMPSNPPRTARVSGPGPDTRRWREQACARVEEAGMGVGMGMGIGDVMGTGDWWV
jgi:hypothetical protein